MRKILLAACGFAAAFVAAGAPAHATFKGPNGLLAYQAQVGDHVQLFTVRPDGTGARQLTSFSDSDATFATWSPDGTTIGFIRQWGPNRARLYTINADGGTLHALDPALRGVVGWFPDGKHVLVMKKLRWTIVTAAGTQPHEAGIPGSGDSQCVLPDGKHAVFVATLGRTDGKAAIFVAEVGGGSGSLRRLTAWESFARKIDCSPDGSRVAFSTPDPDKPQAANVYTVAIDGTGLRKLTHSTGGVDNGLDSWSPDGKKIAFVSNRSGAFQIYTMNADGTGVTGLTHALDAHLAAWGRHP